MLETKSDNPAASYCESGMAPTALTKLLCRCQPASPTSSGSALGRRSQARGAKTYSLRRHDRQVEVDIGAARGRFERQIAMQSRQSIRACSNDISLRIRLRTFSALEAHPPYPINLPARYAKSPYPPYSQSAPTCPPLPAPSPSRAGCLGLVWFGSLIWL